MSRFRRKQREGRERTLYRRGGKLAEYKEIHSQKSYWNDRWLSSAIADVLTGARKKRELGEFEVPFLRHLPVGGLILEAGCGTGKYVAALGARGYSIEGIDFAGETIDRAKKIDPRLNLRPGDVTAIDRPECYYSGYISIGVVEHFPAGPERCLSEAYRVLRPGGRALITVPFLNSPRRRILGATESIQSDVDENGFRFYQYHFSIEDFSIRLKKAGFVVLEVWPYLVFGGLIRDSILGRWLNHNSFFSYRLRGFVTRLCAASPRWVRFRFSHMVLFACQKPQ